MLSFVPAMDWLRCYNSLTNSRIAVPGSSCFIKFSPIRKPLKPAFFNCLIVSGLLIALSDIFKNSDGICSASWYDVSTDTVKSARLRLLTPAASRCWIDAALWFLKDYAPPEVPFR